MQTSSVYLRQMVEDYNTKRIGIPPFQRKFVWTREQIIDMFDSILRGFPIGSFLIWERDSEVTGTMDILTDEDNFSDTPENYILDGRQRLTTFYGCTLTSQDKDEKFDLYFNMEDEGFEYPKKRGVKAHLIKVSDVFDTFRLLDRMSEIRSNFKPEKAELYISRIKRLNSFLQEYAISKVTISQCSLDDATNVFSRLNSKGTDISKTFMLQAMSYKKSGESPLVKVLEDIAVRLAKYDFENIGIDNLLNACFIFEGKKFYDLNLNEMKGLLPLRHEEQIKETIFKTVDFLYEECFIRSWNLVPYSKQFQALIWFFRKHPYPNSNQKKELKKWIFYTSLTLAFQNGSLGNTRFLFSRFSEFINDIKLTAFDYKEINKNFNFDFQPSKKSALSKFYFIILVKEYLEKSDSKDKRFLDIFKIGQSGPEFYFVLMDVNDKSNLNLILNNNSSYNPLDLSKYLLDVEMVEAYHLGNYNKFKDLRRRKIQESINNFIKEYISL